MQAFNKDKLGKYTSFRHKYLLVYLGNNEIGIYNNLVKLNNGMNNPLKKKLVPLNVNAYLKSIICK